MSDSAAIDESSLPNTIEFTFKHRVFSIEGCVFRKTSDGEETALIVPMGEVMAALPINHLQREFDIPPGSDDEKLLKYVIRALAYVRQIYPGDSIPSEVLTGKSPWMVEEQYLELARARVALELVAWHGGEEMGSLDREEMVAAAATPETKALFTEALERLTGELELGEGVGQKSADLVERLAQELSYIEALRAKLAPVKRVQMMLKSLYSAYKDEQSVQESIARCNTLLDTPVKELFEKFSAVDGNTGEIINTLRQFDAQVEYIRTIRDDLRNAYLLWEDLLELWTQCDGSRTEIAEGVIRETYHFAARHFVKAKRW